MKTANVRRARTLSSSNRSLVQIGEPAGNAVGPERAKAEQTCSKLVELPRILWLSLNSANEAPDIESKT